MVSALPGPRVGFTIGLELRLGCRYAGPEISADPRDGERTSLSAPTPALAFLFLRISQMPDPSCQRDRSENGPETERTGVGLTLIDKDQTV